MNKRLSELISEIVILEEHGQDPEITGVHYDSRRVRPGSLFAATDGIHTDGHNYIDSALKNGAAAILHSKPLKEYREGISYIRTKHPRLDISPVSAAFNDYPSKKLKVIGITGTDGKTSTVFLVHQLLSLAGFRSGFLSTAEYEDGNGIQKNPYRQSTPESPEVQEILGIMVRSGCEYAVLETTSHGLSPLTGRLNDVEFRGGIFTNITHEHLEFHGTFENYRRDKSRLFEKISFSTPPGFAVFNSDDGSWEYMRDILLNRSEKKGTAAPAYFTYSMNSSDASVFCSGYRPDNNGSDVTLQFNGRKVESRINIPGSFNVENVMAALLAAAGLTGGAPEDFVEYIPELSGVRGRMRKVDMGQPFTVIVDYAHTPGAFEKILPSVKETTSGRLIVLFGSAGERDRAKRPMQGETAARFSDIIVLADEDPRGEDPGKILEEIAAGALKKSSMKIGENLFLVPPRSDAIDKAFGLAREGDTVLLLGKGHESSIIYKHGPVPWDEEETARERLAHMGFTE